MNQDNLITEYRCARDDLNASLDLLTRSIDLREQLKWGVFDLEFAQAEVAAFKRACERHRAQRRRLAA